MSLDKVENLVDMPHNDGNLIFYFYNK